MVVVGGGGGWWWVVVVVGGGGWWWVGAQITPGQDNPSQFYIISDK